MGRGKPAKRKLKHPNRRSINIDPKVLSEAERRAAEENRTFNNYIETLVVRDAQLAGAK